MSFALNEKLGGPWKKTARAFVAGYTNGYIYYTPTVAQCTNSGYAQEDCDCIVAPERQKIFETKALEVVKALGR